MGISGLLPALQSITRPVHLNDLRNTTVAVDAYVWLHRGAYACSLELCQGIPTDKYIIYCMKQVKLLQHYNIRPILVFDGANLPQKKDQEKLRRGYDSLRLQKCAKHIQRGLILDFNHFIIETKMWLRLRRTENREKAAELLRNGDRSGAIEFFQRAVDVTPRMAYNLIKVLQQNKIDYVVAPYEADAQLTYLSLNGIADAVITEDSDLIPYGATRIIFKLDKIGNGKEIRLADLAVVKEMDLATFNAAMIRHMCILSGCDYLEGVNGLGVKKAHTLIKKYKDDMTRVFRAIRELKNSSLPEDYEERFKRADLTFQHQRVYDPRSQGCVTLRPLPADVNGDELSFIGPLLSSDIIQRIARAEIDPHRHQPFESGTTASSAVAVAEGVGHVAQDLKMYARRRAGVGAGLSKSQHTPIVIQKNGLKNYFKLAQSSNSNTSTPPDQAVVETVDGVIGDEADELDDLPDLSHLNPREDDLATKNLVEQEISDIIGMYGGGNDDEDKRTAPVPTVLAPDTPSPMKSSRKQVVLHSRFFSAPNQPQVAGLARTLDVEFSEAVSAPPISTAPDDEATVLLAPIAATLQASLESDTTFVNSDAWADEDSPEETNKLQKQPADSISSPGTTSARGMIETFLTSVSSKSLPAPNRNSTPLQSSPNTSISPQDVIYLDDDDDKMEISSSQPMAFSTQTQLETDSNSIVLEDGVVVSQFEEVTDSQGERTGGVVNFKAWMFNSAVNTQSSAPLSSKTNGKRKEPTAKLTSTTSSTQMHKRAKPSPIQSMTSIRESLARYSFSKSSDAIKPVPAQRSFSLSSQLTPSQGSAPVIVLGDSDDEN